MRASQYWHFSALVRRLFSRHLGSHLLRRWGRFRRLGFPRFLLSRFFFADGIFSTAASASRRLAACALADGSSKEPTAPFPFVRTTSPEATEAIGYFSIKRACFSASTLSVELAHFSAAQIDDPARSSSSSTASVATSGARGRALASGSIALVGPTFFGRSTRSMAFGRFWAIQRERTFLQLKRDSPVYLTLWGESFELSPEVRDRSRFSTVVRLFFLCEY